VVDHRPRAIGTPILGLALTETARREPLDHQEMEPEPMNDIFYKRYMQPALVALKLPAARFHDLRHSFAVNLLSATPPIDFKPV
jgi:hypothetical protein